MRLTPPNLRDSNRNNGGFQMIGKSGCRVLREQCRVLEMAGWSRRTKWGQQLPNDRCLARLAGGRSPGHRTPVMGSLQEVLHVRPRHIGCLLLGGSAAYLRLLIHSATALACSSFSPGMPLLCGALLPDSPLVRCSAI